MAACVLFPRVVHHVRMCGRRSVHTQTLWPNLALNIRDCISLVTRISRDSDDHVNVGPVSFNWGGKIIAEDDMQPGSDQPHCQHIKSRLGGNILKKSG